MRAGRERRLVTAALLGGMFLAAVEATAVATAMPTAVAELGGVSRYAWAFSAYLLTSTTTVPLFGKLADLYGRRRIYAIAVVIFLVGSALCGAAGSMQQLMFFRALQGIGAGGVVPVAVTVIGDIFPLEERGRMQGLFSAVWAVASIAGPALGGLVTDALSWRWVFYFNLPFGTISALLLWKYLREEPPRRSHRLDLLGTAALTMAVASVLVVLQEAGPAWGWTDERTLLLLALAALTLAFFVRQERAAPEPMFPIALLRQRVIAVALAGGAVLGVLLFTLVAYVPMYAQAVVGGSAAVAGAVLMPMSLAWPITSTIAGMLLLRVGYRALVILGSVITAGGCLLLALMPGEPTRAWLMGAMFMTGAGMGLISTPYLVAVQAAVPYATRGVVTSAQQFSRTIGGAIAVALFGALLNATLRARLGSVVGAGRALDPTQRATLDPVELHAIGGALGAGLHVIFLAAAGLALAGIAIALLFPAGSARAHAHAADVAGTGTAADVVSGDSGRH
ncbi:MAG TPA: MDR family MFS transporter [Longimicrobiales bacterium]|nr:MDR family MFS transporter [Longimicrobiales bacterium]